MASLRFITDEKLRATVERDKNELDQCLEHGLHKSTMLLAGSIVEAILVDFFLAFPRSGSTSKQVLNENLATLIDWAGQDHLIRPRTKELSTVIRNYRNLIHPGREYRLRESVDVHTATVAVHLVELIIEEVAENYATKLGYTAEQVISKVELDPSCASIFPHMIGKMVSVERLKLFTMIPDECRERIQIDAVIQSLIQLHNMLKDHIPPAVLERQVHQVYEYMSKHSRADTMFYLRFFTDNLRLLADEEREAIVDYLLSGLTSSPSEELRIYSQWDVYRGLGELLNTEEGANRLCDFLLGCPSNPQVYPSSFDEALFLHIVGEGIMYYMDWEHSSPIPNRLREYPYKKASEWAAPLDDMLIPF